MLQTIHRPLSLSEWISEHLCELIDTSDDCYCPSEYGVTYMRHGRRVVIIEGWNDGNVDIERYRTAEEASRRMDYLHEHRDADYCTDAVIWNPNRADGGYGVTVEGYHIGEWSRYERAGWELARWIIENGIYPDTFMADEYGSWSRRIDLTDKIDRLERIGVTYRRGGNR